MASWLYKKTSRVVRTAFCNLVGSAACPKLTSSVLSSEGSARLRGPPNPPFPSTTGGDADTASPGWTRRLGSRRPDLLRGDGAWFRGLQAAGHSKPSARSRSKRLVDQDRIKRRPRRRGGLQGVQSQWHGVCVVCALCVCVCVSLKADRKGLPSPRCCALRTPP